MAGSTTAKKSSGPRRKATPKPAGDKPAAPNQSAGTTAAEEQLKAQQAAQQSETERLEQQAKEQAATRDAELKAGKSAHPDGAKQKLTEEGNIAGARRPSGSGSGAQSGFTDQLTRRTGDEPIEGHFVTIDRSADGVEDAYKAAGLEGSSAGNYGVYLTVGERDEETGYPKTIVVRLQDATFTNVTVPYEACTHSESRGI